MRSPTLNEPEAVAYSYACACGTRVRVHAPLPQAVNCPDCDLKHRINRCGFCYQAGHNRRTCGELRRVENTVEAVAQYRRVVEDVQQFVLRPDHAIIQARDVIDARGYIRSNADQMGRMVLRLQAAIREADFFLNPHATEAHERV